MQNIKLKFKIPHFDPLNKASGPTFNLLNLKMKLRVGQLVPQTGLRLQPK